jgi:hypothetical protein
MRSLASLTDHTTSRAITPAHVGTRAPAPVRAMATAVQSCARVIARAWRRTGGLRRAGGASRDRTGDLLVANQALSQLSYGPVVYWPKSPAAISADITP